MKQLLVMDQITKKERNWATDGLVVYNANGLGEVQFQHYNFHNYLMIDSEPLFLHQWYPTYAYMMHSGYGKDKLADMFDDEINELSVDLPFDQLLDLLTPLLQLFPTGLYFLSFIYHCPTAPIDPDNKNPAKFFWTIPKCDYGCEPFSGYPTYLSASQLPKLYHHERVNFYQEKIQRGESLSGIAFYSGDGLVSSLLDGHHRATASYLEQALFPCLTIVPLPNLHNSINTFPIRYFQKSKLDRYSHYLNERKMSAEDTNLVDKFMGNKIYWDTSYLPSDINAGASKYQRFFYDTVGFNLIL
jgi:hypothetical protein